MITYFRTIDATYTEDWVCFTYFLKWKKTNMKYYGSKYAINCNPSMLWNPYKTSSEYVKEYIEIHGDPDIIQIRRTFGGDQIACHAWEQKVLHRIRAIKRKDYLNKRVGFSCRGLDYNNPKHKEAHRQGQIKRFQRPEEIEKMSKRKKEYFKNHPEEREKQAERMRNMPLERRENTGNWIREYFSHPENREKKSQDTKNLWKNPKYREKQTIYKNREDVKKKQSEQGKAQWTPEYRAEKVRLGKAQWTPEYTEQKRQERLGCKVWNNGIKNIFRREDPGEGWVRGMLKKQQT